MSSLRISSECLDLSDSLTRQLEDCIKINHFRYIEQAHRKWQTHTLEKRIRNVHKGQPISTPTSHRFKSINF